jgi:hypothetical protein
MLALEFGRMGCSVMMKISLVFFFYLPYHSAPNDIDAHQCVMFNDIGALYSMRVILIIVHGDTFEH